MTDAPIAAQLRGLLEVLNATIDVVGPEAVQAKLTERKKARDAAALQEEENAWNDRVQRKAAVAVKVLSEASYFFGKAPGDVPVVGPVTAVPEAERPALIGGRVGAKYTIAGRPVVIMSAFEAVEPPAELEAETPAADQSGARKGRRARAPKG